MKKDGFMIFLSFLFCFSWHTGLAWSAEDIRDVKSPVAFSPNFFLIVLVILVILVLIIFLTISIFKKKKHLVSIEPAKIIPPWQKAYEQLEALRKENFLSNHQFNQYYTKLSDIVRRYLEDQFMIKAPEMTTEEFLIYLQNSDALIEDQKEFLKDFLSSCDMVKFAKYAPQLSEAQKSFELAKRLIDETYLPDRQAKTDEDTD